MGIFRRRDRPSDAPAASAGAPPDPVFPQMSVDDVAWIRATAQRVLSGHGVEVTVDNDGADLVATDGVRYTLDNVVIACHRLPREEWPAYVEQHFGVASRMFTGPGIDDLTPEQLRARVRTRLLPVDALEMGGIDMSGYARPVAEDLAAVSVDAVNAIGMMTQIARGIDDAPWSVSPNTYYWYLDEITRIGTTDPQTRHITITPTEDLVRFLDGFAG
ncbi:MAG: hypothetical protein QM774_14310 [Gordonia sp. (in: high G+C Gram-positive bacteria)]|uniref:hypothetical protein n=1 Tax=Gordonia sp. (in: high G+C Gram-positive bacteria) TaxID=84139 RepID=UPI0039E24B43